MQINGIIQGNWDTWCAHLHANDQNTFPVHSLLIAVVARGGEGGATQGFSGKTLLSSFFNRRLNLSTEGELLRLLLRIQTRFCLNVCVCGFYS